MNKKRILQQAASTVPAPAADFGALAQLPVAESMAQTADFATLINLCITNRQMNAACQQGSFWDAFVARFPSEQELFNQVEDALYSGTNMPTDNVSAEKVHALLLRFIMAARKAGKAPLRSDVTDAFLHFLVNDRRMPLWNAKHKASSAKTLFDFWRGFGADDAAKSMLQKSVYDFVIRYQKTPVLWAELQYLLHKLGDDLRSIIIALPMYGDNSLNVTPLQHALVTNNADGLVEFVKAARLVGQSAKDIQRDIENQLRYLRDPLATLPFSNGTDLSMENVSDSYANIMSPSVARALFEVGMRAELAPMGF